MRSLNENMKRDTNGIFKSQILTDINGVKLQLDKCKDAQLLYISCNPESSPEEENQWIVDAQALHDKCNENVFNYLKHVSEIESKAKRRFNTKLESLKLPSFGGNIREYAKFKSEFKCHVEKRVEDSEELPFILRTCLKDT